MWEVQKTDIWKLVTSVKKVLQLENYKEIPDIEIEEDSIDQDQRRISIINNFKDRKILKFNEIFNIKDGRESVIVSFIVILDMIKEGNVLVVEDEDQIQFEYKGS